MFLTGVRVAPTAGHDRVWEHHLESVVTGHWIEKHILQKIDENRKVNVLFGLYDILTH